MEKTKFKVRLPSKPVEGGYLTRREIPTRTFMSHYEVYISDFSDLTKEEHVALLNKLANIGGVGNIRVYKVESKRESEVDDSEA
jgi:hypothetical protein